MTDLHIIILNYNTKHWLEKTLLTLKKYYFSKSKYKVEVVVVDNNSSDSSVQMVKQRFKWVSLLGLKENKGFAAGNNVALRKTSSRYAMLLNSDVEFTVDSDLDSLIGYMDQNREVAVVTPKLVLSNGNIDLACHRGEPTVWASLTYFSKLEKLFPQIELFSRYHQLTKNLETSHQIDACSGAAMIVRNSAIKKVGLLDEQFFMYAEDLDWCKRFRDAGYQIIYNPSATIIHHKNKSGIEAKEEKLAHKTSHHFYDTMLQYYDKHYAHQYPKFVRWLIHKFITNKKGAL